MKALQTNLAKYVRKYENQITDESIKSFLTNYKWGNPEFNKEADNVKVLFGQGKYTEQLQSAIKLKNLASNELYPILSSQVITILGPGDSKSLRWDQIGVNGNQAPAGNYSASVDSDIGTAQTTFSIR